MNKRHFEKVRSANVVITFDGYKEDFLKTVFSHTYMPPILRRYVSFFVVPQNYGFSLANTVVSLINNLHHISFEPDRLFLVANPFMVLFSKEIEEQYKAQYHNTVGLYRLRYDLLHWFSEEHIPLRSYVNPVWEGSDELKQMLEKIAEQKDIPIVISALQSSEIVEDAIVAYKELIETSMA